MSLVRVSHLGKAYRQYSSPWSRLAEWVRPSVQRHTLRWVLRGVEFTLEPGESVGIVGANGAGKSTLLKMIAGTTQCTEGSIEVNGQLSALLELGMGFHPDFTGRQNAIMSGQLIGLTLEQIKELMPFIEAFAEIGDYIDMPVRTYSSGMRMRLAFSVATANRPDVLIIDEALSVGDAYFQHKSFDRIRQLKNEGSSLLIVSHDRSAIQTICDRAILLEGGAVIRQGEPEDVLDFYNALMAKKEHDTIREEKLSRGGVTTISGTGEVEIAEIQLLNLVGDSIEVVGIGESVVVRVKVRVNQAVPSLIVGFMIKDKLGQPIYGINTHRKNQPMYDLEVGEEIEYFFSFGMNIGKGSYSISFSLSRSDSHLDRNYEWRDRGLMIHVVNSRKEDFIGSAWLNAQVDVTRHQQIQAVCE